MQERAEECKAILRDIQIGKKKAILTNFTIDTILIAIGRNKIAIEKRLIFLRSIIRYRGLTIYEVSLMGRFLALQLIERYKLDYEDAITLQTAFSNNAKEILSLDKHFDKVKQIKRVEP